MVSVKEKGDFIYAAGVRQSTADATKFNGYVVKLNGNTGALVWEFDFLSGSGQRSGFETIAFTSDGGFIVGGFSHMGWESGSKFPGFKSGGQIESGRPILHKFSKAVADATANFSAGTGGIYDKIVIYLKSIIIN